MIKYPQEVQEVAEFLLAAKFHRRFQAQYHHGRGIDLPQ
jgi:hypothetical protein